ncbi:hypothetical protein BJ166DRAFT_511519 [Pestalotiopsis sp. NC0098]|nr:hypothetical protein BJ166DRAFT_511519 [Pestalotiopsis sp. NC0098]
MSDNAKASDSAAHALARHFDQQRGGQPSFQRAQPGPSSFRANSAGGHQGNQQFIDNQMSNMSLSDENTQTGLLSANLPQDFFRPMHSPPQGRSQGRSQGHSAAVARFSAAADEAALVEARQNSAFTQQPTFPTADQGAMAPYGHQQQMNAQRSNAYNMQYGAAPRIHPAYRYPGYQPWDHPEIPISQEAAAWEHGFEEAMADWMNEQCDAEKAEYAEAAKVSDQADAYDDAEAAEVRAIAARADADDAAARAGLSTGGTELSQTAQMLVNAVERDESEKFQKSNFLQLMRRIAAQEVVLEGNALVDATTEDPTTPRPRDKGKGKANYTGGKRD